jgi:hypothetical protein
MSIPDPGSQGLCPTHTHTTSFSDLDLSLSPPAVDVINQFVTLATSTSAPVCPPVAILGLTYHFVSWLSTTTLENAYAPFPILPFCSDYYW